MGQKRLINPYERFTDQWYGWIHVFLDRSHKAFVDWIIPKWNEIDSVLEIGCGNYGYYHLLFRNKEYTGVDIEQEVIEDCKKLPVYPNSKSHKFISANFDKCKCDKHDLVLCHNSLDHTEDIPGFLKSMVESANKYIYITLYRGYFPDLKAHKQLKGKLIYYNDLSVPLLKKQLTDMGCKEVIVKPLKTDLVEPDDVKISAIIIGIL